MASERESLGGSWERFPTMIKSCNKKKPYTLLVKWGPETWSCYSPCDRKGKGKRINEKLNESPEVAELLKQ